MAGESKAFGGDQEINDGQGEVRVLTNNNHFIAPVRSKETGALETGLDKFIAGISKMGKDEQLTQLGGYIADAREQIRSIDNPVQRAQASEKYIQGAIRKYGALHAATIENGIKNPETQITYDPDSGDKITKEWDGSITRSAVPKQTPEKAIADHTQEQTAYAMSNAPTLSKEADNLLGNLVDKHGNNVAGKNGEATDIQTITHSVNDYFGNVQRIASNLAAINYVDPFNSKDAKDKGIAMIESAMGNVRDSLLSPRIANIVANDSIPGITPERMVGLWDAFVVDSDKTMAQFGGSLGLSTADQERLRNMKNVSRDQIAKAYEAAGKGDLDQFKRHVERSEYSEKLVKSDWFNGLPRPQQEMIMRAPTMQAIGNAVAVQQLLTSQFPQVDGAQQRTIMSSLGFMAPFMGYNMAEVHMNLLRKSGEMDINADPSKAQNILDSAKIVLTSPLGQAHYDEISKLFQDMKPKFDKLVKDKAFAQEDIDYIYKQLKSYGDARKVAAQSQGLSEEQLKQSNTTVLETARQTVGNWLSRATAARPSVPLKRPAPAYSGNMP